MAEFRRMRCERCNGVVNAEQVGVGKVWRCVRCRARTDEVLMGPDGQPPSLTPEVELRPTAKRSGTPVLVSLAAFGFLAFVLSGFFHFTHGGQTGCHVVTKESWSMDDTVVDMAEIEQMSLLEAIAEGKAPLIRRLIQEGILRNPFEDEPADLPYDYDY